MLDRIWNLVESANRFVWGAPALVLILGTGLMISIGTGFLQFRKLGESIRLVFGKLRGSETRDGISSVQAVCTALAATVGTGNIAGVAGALALGGPGAVFWMWISAFFGMATKYGEVVLAVRYRTGQKNQYLGGPMYTIVNGMGERWRPLAKLYCFFGVIACFGVGNTIQVSTVVVSLCQAVTAFGGRIPRIGRLFIGIVLAAVVCLVMLGGAKRIGSVAEYLVPVMSVCYILLCLGVLCIKIRRVPQAFSAIFQGAFSPKACTGGVIGSWFVALRTGVSRGVFTNEAGMGTASIAHAGAEVDHPSEQGLFGIFEVFADTIVICTLTALVILCSGVPVPYGSVAGSELTGSAFARIYGPWVSVFLAGATALFAFATVLGWGLYGLRCAAFLLGEPASLVFPWLHGAACIFGAVASPALIWRFAELMNGLMAIPNLIAIWALSPAIFRLTEERFGKSKKKERLAGNANGGENEGIH